MGSKMSTSYKEYFKAIALGLALSCSVFAYGQEVYGYIGLESRYFIDDPLFEGQEPQNLSILGELQFYRDFDNEAQRIAATLFSRVDREDSSRTHVDARELYWWKDFSNVELNVGLKKIFWGVTESVHLVDIINQTDTLEGIDGEDKLGQPMVQIVQHSNWGMFSGFVMPYFRERKYPGIESRLRVRIPILEDPAFQSNDGKKHIDYALRWSNYYGIMDVGIAYFSGTSRAPIFVPEYQYDTSLALRPVYNQIDQWGTDVQATTGAWLFKLEAISIYEKGHGRNFASASGVEYSFFSILNSNADLGVIVEYQFDDRDGPRLSPNQNDIVFGVRYAFNDVDSSEVLALLKQDLEYSNRFVSVEINKRLSENWKLEAEARMFSSIDRSTPEYDLRGDDYIQIELRRYF